MVYLVHFARPLHHAQHYLGYCSPEQLDARLADHQASRGAKLLAACNRAAIAYQVVRTGPTGDRHLERRWKRGKNARRRLCPVCRGTAGQ